MLCRDGTLAAFALQEQSIDLPSHFKCFIEMTPELPLHFNGQCVLTLQVSIKDLCVVLIFILLFSEKYRRNKIKKYPYFGDEIYGPPNACT